VASFFFNTYCHFMRLPPPPHPPPPPPPPPTPTHPPPHPPTVHSDTAPRAPPRPPTALSFSIRDPGVLSYSVVTTPVKSVLCPQRSLSPSETHAARPPTLLLPRLAALDAHYLPLYLRDWVVPRMHPSHPPCGAHSARPQRGSSFLGVCAR